MSSAATEQAPTTPKKTPSKAPTKKTPKKAPQSAPEPEAEPEQQDSQKAVPEDEDDTNLTNGYGDEAEDAADDAQDQADDAADEGEQAAEGAGESAEGAGDDGDEPESVAEGAKSQAGDAGEDAEEEAEGTKEQAEDQTEDAKGQVEGATEDAKEEAQDPEDKTGDAQDTAKAAAAGAAQGAQDTAEDAKDSAEDAKDTAEDSAEDAKAQAEDAPEGAEEQAEDAKSQAADVAQDVPGGDRAEDAAEGAQDQAEGAAEGADGEGADVVPIGKVGEDGKSILSDDGEVVGQVSKGEPPAGSIVDQEGDVMDEEGNVIGAAEPGPGNEAEQAEAAKDEAEGAAEEAKDKVEGAGEEIEQQKPQFEGPLTTDEEGAIKDQSGKIIGNLNKDELKKLGDKEISDIDGEGNLLDKDGNIIAKADLAQETLDQMEEAAKQVKEKPEFSGLLKAGKDGAVKDETGKVIANLSDEELKKLGKQKIADIDAEGNLLDKDGNIIATAKIPEPEELDYTILKGLKVNKAGNVTAEDGTIVGKLVDGDAAKLVGKACDEEGRIWNDSGKQIGQAEPLPESERQSIDSKPFEDFPGAVVERSGDVTFEGRVVGKLVEGDKKACEGKSVDVDGDVSDKNGNTIGHAERLEDEVAPEEEAPVEIDYSILVGHKVNKSGAVVNEDDGTPLGKVVEGEVKYLINKKVAKEGKIYNDAGEQIGRAEPIPENERITPTESPFEDFQPSIVQKNGDVIFNGQKVGEVSEGDPKKLAGKQVDPDGDIVDKAGSSIGKAIRWEEPEAEEEKPVDNSALAGKRVNKSGYVADPSSGMLYGRVVEGDPKKLQGKMCDKDGNIWDEGGNKVGRAELIPESEREGSKNGPFTDFQPCTVTKDGTCVDAAQNIVGRLVEGDAKTLYGKQVDEDGDVNDNNGNKIGRAERWEPEEKQVDKHAAAGLKVNKEGNVINADGDIIAKLTNGDIAQCRGKEIDDDGNVIDGKGKQVGYVTLIEDIKDEGPTQEELEAQRKKEEEEAALSEEQKKDRDLAKRLGFEIDQTLDRIKPILDEMMEYIDEADGKDPKDVDQDKLVDNVKPLIHKAGDILNECNSNIRNMDPDGRIQSKAKQNAGTGEASPEEQHLAEGLKTLTGSVQDTIDKAKKKINNLPKAKEELNPLWGLMSEPLFQILAAVGLLLSGVLGLVGKLLGGLGLGGIVDSVLGGLGISSIMDGVTGLLG